MKKRQKVLIIVGPTSSGKSALAVEIARKFNGEVISADSRQVYRGLNIGTGKISKREMKGVPHHLLNEVSPHCTFTAHDFALRGIDAIAEILQKRKLPIVAGGTGFYIDALLGRVALPDVPANAKLRVRLTKKTAPQLFALLKKRDQKRAKTMNTPSERNNKVRLIRSLEITYASRGQHLTTENRPREYDALWIGIAPPLKKLEKKIATRLSARMKQGMVNEARRLNASGLSYKRMHELGLEYRSLASLLQKKVTRTQMVEELRRAIRKYAKRQMAYWKRNQKIIWFNGPNVRSITKLVRTWNLRAM